MKENKSVSEETYRPASCKNFRNALENLLKTEFPRLGGTKVRKLLVDELISLFEAHHLTQERVAVGQMLWYAVDKEDRPYCYKKMSDTKLVPVILSLVNGEDIEVRRRGKEGPRERMKRRAVRLYGEAYEQGGVLSHADVSLIMGCCKMNISKLVTEYEEEHGVVIPRRGTIHDLGSSMSHKGTICRKAILEGKQTPDIARETSHDEKSVDRYLLDFDRVAFAMLKHGMSIKEICFTTRLSQGLVSQYADMIKEFGLSEEDLPLRKHDVREFGNSGGS